MKRILLDLINYILQLLLKKEVKEKTTEPVVEEPIIEQVDPIIKEPILEPVEEVKEQEVVNVPQEQEQAVEEPKQSVEVYSMLPIKERQTYLKKLGFYTSGIDGIVGKGTKKAIKQFNITFSISDTDVYREATDKILREIYNSYNANKYMVDSDWKYFLNFKKSEYKCHCNGKYCNGYPSGIAMRLIMADQYQRNYYGKSMTVTSGVRCNQHNKNVGGTSNSYHKQGRASDTITKGVSSATVRKMIYKNSTTGLPFVTYAYDITKSSMHKTVSL